MFSYPTLHSLPGTTNYFENRNYIPHDSAKDISLGMVRIFPIPWANIFSIYKAENNHVSVILIMNKK